jgi:hypothetical protein
MAQAKPYGTDGTVPPHGTDSPGAEYTTSHPLVGSFFARHFRHAWLGDNLPTYRSAALSAAWPIEEGSMLHDAKP